MSDSLHESYMRLCLKLAGIARERGEVPVGSVIPQIFNTLPCCNLPRPLTASSVVLHLAIDSTNPDVLYAGTHWRQSCVYLQRRVFKSVDGGANWTDSISPSINGCDNIHALVLAPSDPNTLYVSAFDGMGDTWSPLVRSNDAMASWTYLGFPTTQVLAVDPVDSPNRLYAATPSGVFKN